MHAAEPLEAVHVWCAPHVVVVVHSVQPFACVHVWTTLPPGPHSVSPAVHWFVQEPSDVASALDASVPASATAPSCPRPPSAWLTVASASLDPPSPLALPPLVAPLEPAPLPEADPEDIMASPDVPDEPPRDPLADPSAPASMT